MRDAFGGVFTMNFLLVFIFIYVAFTAVSLNYAKAYRVKNAVIDFVEQQEITDLDKFFGVGSYIGDGADNLDKLSTKISSLSYYKTCDSINKNDIRFIDNLLNFVRTDEYCYNGVVLQENRREKIDGTNSEIVYYDVITYANWDLGALNKLLALAGRGENSESKLVGTWSVKGEAKVVVKG